MNGQQGLHSQRGQNGGHHPDAVSSPRVAAQHSTPPAPRKTSPSHFTAQGREAHSRLQCKAMPGQSSLGKGSREPHTALVRWEVQRSHHSTAQPRISLEKQK